MSLAQVAARAGLVALATSLACSSALAEAWQGALLDRAVAMEIPSPFAAEPGYADANATQAIIEFLPPGETVEAWRQMLTLTAFVDASGQPADLAVMTMANHLAEGYGNACPEAFAAEDLGAPALAGAEAVFAAWLGCGEVGGIGQSEAMVVLVFAAGGKIFTAQWAEHGTATAGPPVFDRNHWMPRLDALMSLEL